MSTLVPLNPYNYPSVVLQNVIDREFSLSGFLPGMMGVHQRTSYSERLKEAAGGGILMDTLIDIVTNPWVILSFLTSSYFKLPLPGELTSVGAKASAFVREHGGILQALNLSWGSHILRGTYGEALLHQINRSIKQSHDEAMLMLSPAYTRLVRGAGISSLKDDKFLSSIIFARLEGLDRDVTQTVKVVRKGEVHTRKYKRPALVDSSLLDEALHRYDGATEFVNSVRSFLNHRFRTLFGNSDGTDVDPEKVLAVWRGMEKLPITPVLGPDARLTLARSLGSKSVLNAMKSEDIPYEVFLGAVREAFLETLPRYYMPRNAYRTFIGGVEVDPASMVAQNIARRTIAPPGFSLMRVRAGSMYAPDDLEELLPLAGEHRKNLEKAIEMADKRMGSEEPVMFASMDVDRILKKYAHQSANTKALLVDPLGDEVIELQKRTMPFLEQALLRDPDRMSALQAAAIQTRDGVRHEVWWPMTRSTPSPPGGWTPADALYALWVSIPDKATRNSITDVLLPQILGEATPRQSALHAVVTTMQGWLTTLLKSPIGEKLKTFGELGASIHDRLLTLAESGAPTGSPARALASYFYATHLGLNPGSIFLNMTQPLITTIRLFPMGLGLRLYGEALLDTSKRMFSYLKHRASSKRLWLTTQEKQELLGTYFDLVSSNWDNAIGVGSDAIEMLDTIGIGGIRLGQQQTPFWKMIDLLMKGFDKSEIFNRNITGEMIRRYARLRAPDLPKRVLISEIRRVVSETQFAATPLNTPLAFMKEGSWFNSPLMRQFLTFPIRMAASTMAVFPEFGGEGYMKGLIRDLTRGMGYSALVYEAFKNLTGVSLERGLYAEAVTDLFLAPLEQTLPPIISIPKGLMDGLLTGDQRILLQDIPRLLPGGVAVSRALGVMPHIGEDTPLSQVVKTVLGQRSYVDWDRHTPEGLVPLMRYDGTLIAYESPLRLILKGLGLAQADQMTQRELEKLMLMDREKVLTSRRRYVDALLRNDVPTAETIRQAFSRRHGYDLRVTPAHIMDRLRIRERTRPERILETLPPELREQYLPFVAEHLGSRLGMSSEEFMAYETARQRDAIRSARIVPDNQTMEAIRRVFGINPPPPSDKAWRGIPVPVQAQVQDQ